MIKRFWPGILLKQYKYELIAFCINISIALLAFKFKDNVAVFLGVVVISIISLFFIIYNKTKDKDFFWLPLNKPGKIKDWVGRGKFIYIHNERSFEITNSNVGYLLPKTILWDDYRFEFDFKIVNKTVAWIVRASGLSNYVMFQCTFEGINPHIRIDGEWIQYKHSDINFSFLEALDPDIWYRGVAICEKRSIRNIIYRVKDGEVVFDRHWKIPEGEVISKEEGNNQKIKYFKNIDFDFGAVGFRNYGSERGFIKNVYIEKI